MRLDFHFLAVSRRDLLHALRQWRQRRRNRVRTSRADLKRPPGRESSNIGQGYRGG
jgi:hypothetical protein